jgi:hypothetical protein
VAPDPVAGHQKKARRRDAHPVLIDESGSLMAPLARRSWAPRGHPPAPDQCGGHLQKVSVAALRLSPRRDRPGLNFQTLPGGCFGAWYVAAFPGAMSRDLSGRFVEVWGGGPMHQGDPIRRVTSHFADRLSVEALPPWAPTLNPVESLWGWLKDGRLCDLAPHDIGGLDGRARRAGDDPRRSGVLEELVPCLGTPAPADITFLTRCKLRRTQEPHHANAHARFTRLTNAFSKKIENLQAAVAFYSMHYDFVRRHQSLRITPAMAAGVDRHLWSIEEIVSLID